MVRDVQLDSAEVSLEKEIYCEDCKVLMKELPNGTFICRNCGETYSEK